MLLLLLLLTPLFVGWRHLSFPFVATDNNVMAAVYPLRPKINRTVRCNLPPPCVAVRPVLVIWAAGSGIKPAAAFFINYATVIEPLLLLSLLHYLASPFAVVFGRHLAVIGPALDPNLLFCSRFGP